MDYKSKRNKEQLKYAQAVRDGSSVRDDIYRLAENMFANPRTMQLGGNGCKMLTNHTKLEQHILDLPGINLKSSHIIHLGRNVTVPFYRCRDKQRITFFGFDQSAFEIIMHGDLDVYVQTMKSQENREYT